MAISIDWGTRVITIPQADLTHVSGPLYELDVDDFRLALKDLEDGVEGMPFPDTHSHNTAVTLSGVTYSRTFQVINGYTVTFQDVGSPYTVRCVGANHNIADVKNVNQVSLIVGNSAGLITVVSGSGVTQQDKDDIVGGVLEGEILAIIAKILRNKTVTDPATGVMTVYDDNGTSVLLEADLFENAAGTQQYRGQGAERRERLE
jgi:hypothetical protein